MTNNNDNAGLIDGTSIDRSWLEELISKEVGSKAIISEVAPLGSEAVGFMSVMRRVFLENTDGTPFTPKTVIVKTPSTAGGMEAITAAGGHEKDSPAPIDLQIIFHRTECNALNVLHNNRASHKIKIPKVYAANDMCSKYPCIVMEDLVDTHVVDVIDGFNKDKLYQLMDQIIELQAFSLLHNEWREEETQEDINLADASDPMMRGIFDNFFSKYVDTFGELGSKLREHTIDKERYTLTFQRKYTTGERKSVLCHGDMWSANFLWNGDKLAGVVDWQLAHAGSPVEDILRILSTCTTSKNRKTLTKELLDYYYAEMQEKVGKMPFTREELDEEMHFYKPYGCVWTIFANAFWVPQVLGSEERIKESFDRCLTYMEETVTAHGW